MMRLVKVKFLVLVTAIISLSSGVASANEGIEKLLLGVANEIVEQALSEPAGNGSNQDTVSSERKEPKKQMSDDKDKVLINKDAQDSAVKPMLTEVNPCLAGVCVGMTIQEVLDKNINFWDGRKVLKEEQSQRIKKMESAFAGQPEFENAPKEMLQPRLTPADPESRYFLALKNSSPQMRSYLSEFYPMESPEGLYLDRKALEYMSSTKQCDFFKMEAVFLSENDHPVSIEFLPLEDDFIPRVSMIVSAYNYTEAQVEEFRALTNKKYEGHAIGHSHRSYDYSLTQVRDEDLNKLPAVMLLEHTNLQELILQDRKRWLYAESTGGRMPDGSQEKISRKLKSQTICLSEAEKAKPTIE